MGRGDPLQGCRVRDAERTSSRCRGVTATGRAAACAGSAAPAAARRSSRGVGVRTRAPRTPPPRSRWWRPSRRRSARSRCSGGAGAADHRVLVSDRRAGRLGDSAGPGGMRAGRAGLAPRRNRQLGRSPRGAGRCARRHRGPGPRWRPRAGPGADRRPASVRGRRRRRAPPGGRGRRGRSG